MAIKAALAASLLVALLALAGATTFTTTVTTTTIEDHQSQQQQKQQCQQQLQGRQFQDCQRYLTQSQRQGGGEIELVTRNPYGPQTQAQKRCCESLKQVERQQPQCGCEAIKHALQKVQQSGQRSQSPQVYSRAQMLPQVCQLRAQQCEIGVVFV